MYNQNIDSLTDYPFDRLRKLLQGLEPPNNLEVLSLSLGEPQHKPPNFVTEIISNSSGDWAKYPPVIGSHDLLEAISEWLNKRYALSSQFIDVDSNIVAVNGTKEALFMLGDLSISRHTERPRPAVLMPNPFYQVYLGSAIIRGAEPIYVAALKENGFMPKFEALEKPTLDRTCLAYLCTPSNPEGSIASIKYLQKLVELARKYNFILAVDECYAEIYDKTPPPGILQVCQEMGDGLDNILSFHSLSKRSNVPGLRSGFVAGDSSLIEKLKTLRNYGGAAIPLPLLNASAALWRDESHVEQNRELYRKKFDLADKILGKKFSYARPGGGFYLWLNVGNGEEAASRLWSEAAVKVMPGAYLSKPDNNNLNPGEKYIRVALVQEPAFVSQSLSRMVNTL